MIEPNEKIQVSLKEFLTTGRLGRIWFGDTPEQIERRLGPPTDYAPNSRKDKRPGIYKYGDLEFHFSGCGLNICWLVFLERSEGKRFRLPKAFKVSGWPLNAASTRLDVEAYLEKNGIEFQPYAIDDGPSDRLRVLESGITLGFEDPVPWCSPDQERPPTQVEIEQAKLFVMELSVSKFTPSEEP